MGGLPPKAAQSAMWQWPSTPISGRDARHTQAGRSGISPNGATAKSPINRAIHDNRHLRPLSRERSPALCTFRLWAPRFWRLDSEQPRCIFTENSAPCRIVEPVCAFDKADRVDFAHIRRIVGAHQDVIGVDPIGFIESANRLEDRKSTRLNSSHTVISYAVFCLKK